MKTWTAGKLAKEFGLSRSALLYYDAIGLLSPLERSDAGYRLYSEAMVERLRRICAYRETGMPLKEIAGALRRDAKAGAARKLLLRRFEAIGAELRALRAQQRLVASMLAGAPGSEEAAFCGREAFIGALRKAGLSDEDMRRFHEAFEKGFPGAHGDFLGLLGFTEEEIAETRRRFKK